MYVHNPSVLAVLPRTDSTPLKVILGILNSRLMSLVFLHVAPKSTKGLFPKVIITDARRLPVPNLDSSARLNGLGQRRIERAVERMLSEHTRLGAVRTDHEKEVLQRQIDATDREIDALVYELYGLTDEEIRAVESDR